MYQVRSTISGVIKTIYKQPGEAVKSLEPIVQLHNLTRLQAEGLVDVQHWSRLRKGMRVVLEPTQVEGPEQVLLGHLQAITSVVVSKDPDNPAIVSASEDGTVRVWDRATRHERRVLRHPAAVRALDCTGPATQVNWCLSGAADGIARLWDLGGNAQAPLREFKGQHHGALTCVAFSPDARLCATGGEDREICLWDTVTGQLRYRLPSSHRGAITSLQFTPQAQLVSAGCDNTLRLWALGQHAAHLETTLDCRSGDVTSLGVSRDGKHALFDQGKMLRLLSLPDCVTESVLQTSSGPTHFTTFALFSPDARSILTAGASEGRLQLWRAPSVTQRGHELCQLVSPERSPATCAAFAPDGSFVVTGTRDRQVLVWPVPTPEEMERQVTAEVTLIERAMESTAGQVRIWAELPNLDGRLLPGTTVTMVIYPDR
jgi:WD40 repeat protein